MLPGSLKPCALHGQLWGQGSYWPSLDRCRRQLSLSTGVQTLGSRVRLCGLSAGHSGQAGQNLSWTLTAQTAMASLSRLTQPWESCQKLWTWQASRVLRYDSWVDQAIGGTDSLQFL